MQRANPLKLRLIDGVYRPPPDEQAVAVRSGGAGARGRRTVWFHYDMRHLKPQVSHVQTPLMPSSADRVCFCWIVTSSPEHLRQTIAPPPVAARVDVEALARVARRPVGRRLAVVGRRVAYSSGDMVISRTVSASPRHDGAPKTSSTRSTYVQRVGVRGEPHLDGARLGDVRRAAQLLEGTAARGQRHGARLRGRALACRRRLALPRLHRREARAGARGARARRHRRRVGRGVRVAQQIKDDRAPRLDFTRRTRPEPPVAARPPRRDRDGRGRRRVQRPPSRDAASGRRCARAS